MGVSEVTLEPQSSPWVGNTKSMMWGQSHFRKPVWISHHPFFRVYWLDPWPPRNLRSRPVLWWPQRIGTVAVLLKSESGNGNNPVGSHDARTGHEAFFEPRTQKLFAGTMGKFIWCFFETRGPTLECPWRAGASSHLRADASERTSPLVWKPEQLTMVMMSPSLRKGIRAILICYTIPFLAGIVDPTTSLALVSAQVSCVLVIGKAKQTFALHAVEKWAAELFENYLLRQLYELHVLIWHKQLPAAFPWFIMDFNETLYLYP